MKKIVPLSLAIACLNFELYASTWKCYTNEQGEVRHLFVPSEDNIQRVAMVPVRDDIEIAVPEGAELAGYPAEKSSAIRSELVRYALRPYIYVRLWRE